MSAAAGGWDYAQRVRRDAMLTEVARLKTFLPDTDATKRNVAAIEKVAPPERMPDERLSDYLNLLARSVPNAALSNIEGTKT